MSFLTFVPIGYTNTFNISQNASQQPRAKFPAIFESLAQALRTSINRYELTLSHIKKQQEEVKIPEIIAVQVKPLEKKAQPVPEEKKEKKQDSKIRVIEESPNQGVKGGKKKEKQLKESSQNSTNDETREKKQKKDSKRKQLQNHHLIRKDKHKHKKGCRRIRTSDVSLIDDARCPSLTIAPGFLEHRKESLLQRQVWIWDQKLKNRRDKRQIRMLNC